ncbi:kelch repeat and BTB domain-containing protein 2-like [Branchiostoma floridae x Branchiostoma belcheri]
MNVRNPEHPSAVLRELNSQRERAELTDVVLEVEGKSFPCHRAVLACCSPYFRAMFTSSYAEAKQDRVNIRDVSAVAMETVLDYAYTGCLDTEPDQVQAVMSAAKLLQVDFVCCKAAEYMKEHLDVSNCADVLMYADMLGDSGLVEAGEKYIASRFREAVLQPSFLQLSLSQLLSLLDRDDLITQSEDDVVQAALKWIDFNQAERSQHLPALCKTLRHPFISSEQREEIERRCPSSVGVLVYSGNTNQRLGQKRTEVQINLSRYFGADHKPYFPCYDPATGAANSIDLPAGLDGQYVMSMAATPEGDLYLAANVNVGNRRQGGQQASEIKKKFYLYNHLLGTWELRSEMITKWTSFLPRCELVALNGYIYAIGGDQEKGMAERYDPSRDEWTSVPPFPHPVSLRSGLCAMALNDSIYVIRKEGCHCFSTAENRWDRIADMVEPAWFPRAVTYRGRIYCVNSIHSGVRPPTYVVAYDPLDGVWKRTGSGEPIVYDNGQEMSQEGTHKTTLLTHEDTLYLFSTDIIHSLNSYSYWEESPRPSRSYVHQYLPETDAWVAVTQENKRRLLPPKLCRFTLTALMAARMFPSWLGYDSYLDRGDL